MVNLSRIDLNLFVIFDVIYQEGNLTRAAERLHLSQPAVSHALARLRAHFNDPLFERSGKGMLPTPLAKAMIESVRAALQQFENTLNTEQSFEPENANRVFSLAAREIMEATALPKLMSQLGTQAPNIQLRSVRVGRRELENALLSGKVDLAADVLLPVSEAIAHQQIATEKLVVVMREQHPLNTKEWNIDTYLSAQHVQVSSRVQGLGLEDFALTRIGKARQITLRCQNYHAAVKVIEETDLLLTLPASYARQIKGIALKEFPLPMQSIELYLYWQRKAEADPALMWLKENIVGLFTL